MAKNFKDDGINFHKLIQGLSNNALKHLINMAHLESNKRRSERTFPEFENKELPTLVFSADTRIVIRDESFKITKYSLDGMHVIETTPLQTVIDLKMHDWQQMVHENRPMYVVLENEFEEKLVELHSRSKIFWLFKLIESTVPSETDQDR